MDANTGKILAEKNIDVRMPPASLTKLMTLYQIANGLKEKRLQLTDTIPISEKAWRTGGSKMFVKVGDRVSLDNLIQGIVVVSGNDACVAVAEHMAGTEEAFSDLMNKTAAKLGMNNTHYTDATGLNDPNHYTSPRDLALLAQAIINHFPEYYPWFSQKTFEYNGIKQNNRDILLWRDQSVDGMKTGHTSEAGYCLVSSAKRNGMRLISVIMDANSPKARADASMALLNYGFRFYETQKLFTSNTTIKKPRVWFGKNKYLPLGVNKDFYITLPTGKFKNLKTTVVMKNKITAPLLKGDKEGDIMVTLNDAEIASEPLVALEDNPKGGFFSRITDHIIILFYYMFHSGSR
jgi:D-alanyl-D-alanine carboxypeptidase (penicillin-binding protein 5/6)